MINLNYILSKALTNAHSIATFPALSASCKEADTVELFVFVFISF